MVLYNRHVLSETVSQHPVSFHPVPWAMARVVFLSRKKIDERFQSNAILLFLLMKGEAHCFQGPP